VRWERVPESSTGRLTLPVLRHIVTRP
jgi:hypothetical protein